MTPYLDLITDEAELTLKFGKAPNHVNFRLILAYALAFVKQYFWYIAGRVFATVSGVLYNRLALYHK